MYAETHGLTDKQQKLATKVRRREARITNLQTEMERIKVRQPGPGLVTLLHPKSKSLAWKYFWRRVLSTWSHVTSDSGLVVLCACMQHARKQRKAKG